MAWPVLPDFYAKVTVSMAMPALACLVLVLYGSASGVEWLYSGRSEMLLVPGNGTSSTLPTQVSIPGNGLLGMTNFCPNTAPAVARKSWIEDNDIPRNVPPGPCYEIEWNCLVTFCVFGDSFFTNTTSEQVGVCARYDIFKPLPFYENDGVHKILELFPGGGNCAAFNSTRVFHWAAFSCSVFGVLISLKLIMFFKLRSQYYFTISAKVLALVYLVAAGCAFIAICVWDGSIARPSNRGSTNIWSQNHLGDGFWLEVASLIFSDIAALAAGWLSVVVRVPLAGAATNEEGGSAKLGGEVAAIKAECAAAHEQVQTLQAALAEREKAVQAKEAEVAAMALAAAGAKEPANQDTDPSAGVAVEMEQGGGHATVL